MKLKKVKNVDTGEEKEFYSIGALTLFLGEHNQYKEIWRRV
jgi:hypothetical protein